MEHAGSDPTGDGISAVTTQYTVAIPRSVRVDIQNWDVPEHVVALIFEAIETEFGSRSPDDLGNRVCAPIPCFVTKLRVDDPRDGLWYEFYVWVNERAPNTRVVLEAKRDWEDLM